ncbi:MAG: hypothetical protein QM662_15585 [Gordonia sp. (in: high G+C Gram-positive bacteria)]
MPQRFGIGRFGIGSVVAVLCAALVVTVGVVLGMGVPDHPDDRFTFGTLRAYPDRPATAWSVSSLDLPDYSSNAPIEVAGTQGPDWLLSYPSGLGRAYLLVRRTDGHRRWTRPLRAGLGGCALTDAGTVGCAIVAGDRPDGFYLLDATGTPGTAQPLDDTASVLGVGENFLRLNRSGYRATLRTPTGDTVWERRFDATATPHLTSTGLLNVSTNDAGEYLLDPASGADRAHCSRCTITEYPTGIAVTHHDPDRAGVDTFALDGGLPTAHPTATSAGLQVIAGPSQLAVLTATGDAQLAEPQGTYEIRDPAQRQALWQITDPELSKANTRPCGRFVVFALKDRSRTVYDLATGAHVGALPVPDATDPDTNIDYLRCVGSTGPLVVFTDEHRLSAFDPTRATLAWTLPVGGEVSVVDGYLVVRQGTELSVLRPT